MVATINAAIEKESGIITQLDQYINLSQEQITRLKSKDYVCNLGHPVFPVFGVKICSHFRHARGVLCSAPAPRVLTNPGTNLLSADAMDAEIKTPDARAECPRQESECRMPEPADIEMYHSKPVSFTIHEEHEKGQFRMLWDGSQWTGFADLNKIYGKTDSNS